MRIGIIEICTDNHYTAVIAKARTFQEEGNEIFIFVNEGMIKNLKGVSNNKEIKIIARTKRDSINNFIKKIKDKDLDIILINTLQGSLFDLMLFLHFFMFNLHEKKIKTYVTIHDINWWFERYRFDNIKSLMMRLIKNMWKIKMSGVCVNSQNLKDYLIKKFNFKKPVIVIPFIIYEGSKDLSKENDGVLVSIVGTLSEERREYLKVLGEFEKIPKDLSKKITLELLGAPSTGKDSKCDKIIKKCKLLKEKGLNLIFYERFLSPEEYSERLMKCDIIFGSIKMKEVYLLSRNIGETYGVSKDTGTGFNMINGAKPGLLPKGFANLEELESSTIYFSNYKEAFEIMIKLSKDKEKLNKLKEKALENSKKFSPQKVRERLRETKILEYFNQ